MPIVNSNKIYYLYSYVNHDELIEVKESKSVSGFGGRTLKFRNFSELPVYYLEFNTAKSLQRFKLSTFIDSEVITKIQNKELFLVLNNSNESFHDIVESVYVNIIDEQLIPASQIILCSESSDLINEVKIYSEKYNKDPIKVEWIRQCEFEAHLNSKKFPTNSQTLQLKDYPKKFLCLNRRWRPHRPTLVGLLKSFNLLDKGYVSLGESDDNQSWLSVWDTITRLSKINSFVYDKLITDKENICSIGPLYVDTSDLKTNWYNLESSILKYYTNTYFSVVTETNFYTNFSQFYNQTGRLLSEKIFKPIAVKHPFIVVSVPNFLDKLKELGYKTFSPYINEYYDTVLDDNERLHAIILEIERLCNLNDEQLQVFLNGVKDIVEHNHNVLLSKKIFHNKLYE